MKIGQKENLRRAAARKTRAARAPAVRVPLSRERIVAEALVQIDRDGLEGFSTRKLGDALGVQAMSLYHHFPSKAHVLDAVVEFVVGQVAFLPETEPVDKRLRATMRSYREVALRYPGFFPLFAVHRMNMAAGIEFVDCAVRLFNDACPDDLERAARLFRVAGYYLNGACLDETMGYGRGPSARNPAPNDWVAREHPAVVAAGKWFAPSEHEKTFEFGLDMLMQALGFPPEVRPRRAATSSPGAATRAKKPARKSPAAK
jgi:AcrR family transcriptional regulator